MKLKLLLLSCLISLGISGQNPPVAICQDITIQLDGSGMAMIVPMDVDNGSNDPDGDPVTLSLDIDTFTCSEIGPNIVTLTVDDMVDGVDTCMATVTVEELMGTAVAVCQDITIQLDAVGMATIMDSDLDGGSSGTGSCETLSFSASQTTFLCDDVFNPLASSLVLTGVVDGPIPENGGTIQIPDQTLAIGVEYYLVTSGYAAGQFGAFTNTINGPGTVTCPSAGGSCSITSDCNLNDTTPDDSSSPDIWSRPIGKGSTISGLGPVSYDVYGPFTVDTAGDYTFESLQVGWNGYLHIYQDCFDPTDPLTNLIGGDNDGLAGTPKALELFVLEDIADLSLYGIGIANDGGGSDGEEFTFPAVAATAGTYIHMASESTDFNSFFGFMPDHVSPVIDFDGNDAVELFFSGAVIDTFGDVNVDGTGTSWDYHDGWAHRVYETTTDGSGVFDTNFWFYSGTNALDDETLNSAALITFPITTFTFNIAGSQTPIAVTLTVTNSNGTMDTCMANVTVEDNIAPVAVANDITLFLDIDGEKEFPDAEIDMILMNSTDNCQVAFATLEPSDFSCVDIGDVAVDITVFDDFGNTDVQTITVTVEDNFPPDIYCKDITIQLGPAGTASFVPTDLDDGSTDACGIETFSVDISSFTCADVGPNNVILTATDFNGNVSTCMATVTVEDGIAPTAVCQDITVALVNGSATILPSQIDNGSSDVCGTITSTLNISTFDCSDLGSNTVFLTVEDASGNTAACSAVVTVIDTEPPNALCQDITVQLSASGTATISALDVDSGSNDACGNITRAIDISTFDCSDLGNNAVMLTIMDANGNSASCSANVFVEDTIPPVANCQDITVSLDAAGMVTITPADVDAGSSVSCGAPVLSIDITAFDCTDIGTTVPVTLTVMNGGGSSSMCIANVTVVDTAPPIAVCQDLTVQLVNGNATILPSEVDNGSTDNCDVTPSLALDISSFDCSNVGTNTVQLTVTDSNGNSSNCSATITVEDTDSPMAICQNITVPLDASGNVTIDPIAVDGGSTDSCAIVSRSLDVSSFNCTNLGPNTVQLTVTDGSGNSDTCMAMVTIEDVTPPTIVCQNITVQLDVSGNASIVAADVDGGTTDACGSPVLTINNNFFSCFNVGANNVLLTAMDASGNSSSCNATVTVEDNVAPNALCQNITVQLDASGNAFITVFDIDAGSNDACGILTTNIDVSTFNCDDLGANNVVLTVTDINGNIASCTAVVTVVDSVDPMINCPANDVVVIPIGSQYTLPDYFADGLATATDNCTSPIANIVQNPIPGTQLDPGTYTISLTATDASGNNDDCTFQLIVELTLGNADNVAASELMLYPNPATNSITLYHTGNQRLEEAILYDLTGKRIKKFDLINGIDAQDLDISEIANSMYFLAIKTEQGIIMKQIIKE